MSGNAAGIMAILLWSVANLLVSWTGNVPAFQLGFMVMVPGGLLMTGVQMARGLGLRAVLRQTPFAYAVTFSGIGGYILLHYVAFKIAPPFEVNITDYTWPLFLVVFSALIHKDDLGFFKTLGIGMGFLGMVLLFSDGAQGFQSEYIAGYICSLMGAVLFGLYGALTRKVHFDNGFIGIVFLATGFVSLLLHMVFEKTVWPESLGVWLAIIGLAVIRLAYDFWDHAMKNGDAVLLASLSYFLPLFSAALFVVFGHLPMTWGAAIAAVLIIGGCLMVNFNKIREMYQRRYS